MNDDERGASVWGVKNGGQPHHENMNFKRIILGLFVLIVFALWLVGVEGWRRQMDLRTGEKARVVLLAGLVRTVASGIDRQLGDPQRNANITNITNAVVAYLNDQGLETLERFGPPSRWPRINADFKLWTNWNTSSEVAVFYEDEKLGVFSFDFSGQVVRSDRPPNILSLTIADFVRSRKDAAVH